MKRAIVLSACAVALAAAGPHHRSPDAIAFEVSSWGKPLISWRVAADGRGTYTKSEGGRDFQHYRLVTRRFAAGRTAFAKLDAALTWAAGNADREVPCGSRISDFPYGTVTWTIGHETRRVRFDTGCQSAEAKRVEAAVSAADALVAKWSVAGPIVETREVAP
ncbi:MAG: hypothetical protein QOE79_846 [Sphingomonadales bacterium]|jgi:hypothetical protein|nr:hypothetical protein [Sphingomonadales bacterium]